MKRCPYCAEDIQEDAIVCRYCGKQVVKKGNAFLKYFGVILFVLLGLYGMYITFGLVANEFGLVAGFFSLLLTPLVAVLVPWYLLFAYGVWGPLVIIYGGGFIANMLYRAGLGGTE